MCGEIIAVCFQVRTYIVQGERTIFRRVYKFAKNDLCVYSICVEIVCQLG